jgi:carboxypeptidase Q
MSFFALDYRCHTIHSQVDSLGHVVRADLLQGTQVMAVTAWGLLNGQRLPHQPPQPGH